MSIKPPELVFKDRNYSQQALVSLITANYIVFSILVQCTVNCNRVHWFLWVGIAGLAVYNYFTIKRNLDEFSEKRNQIIYIVSVLGLSIMYYLLGVVALRCSVVKPL